MAILKVLNGPAVIRQQLGQGIVVSLGLQQGLVFQLSQLADRAIHRADYVAVIIVQWPGIDGQGPGEKVIEVRIGRRIGLCRFAHVHAEQANKII